MGSIFIKIVLLILTVGGFGYVYMFNARVLHWLENIRIRGSGLLENSIGKKIIDLNKQAKRRANLNRKSVSYKIYYYFESIIIDLGMKQDSVTVAGLLVFITCVSLCGSFILSWLLNARAMIFISFCVTYYLTVVVFKFMSLLRHEKWEALIMDAEDLMVSDITRGVQNAIVKYESKFHPLIRCHFTEFKDSMAQGGIGFEAAMRTLADNLGPSFASFAQKAIYYEKNADDTLDDIFSPILKTNRRCRTLRTTNARVFNAVRLEFIVSCLVIAGYAVYGLSMDDYFKHILTETSFGKTMILADFLLISWVLASLASIKAKSL